MKKPLFLLAILAIFTLGCDDDTTSDNNDNNTTNNTTNNSTNNTTNNTTNNSTNNTTNNTTNNSTNNTNHEVCDDHDSDSDHTWSLDEVEDIIIASGVSSDSDNVTCAGNIATITAGGIYRLSGTSSDAQIVVDSSDSVNVVLVLDGVDLSYSAGPAINILNAEKTILHIADGSTNQVEDSSEYPSEEEANAAIHCKSDLTISGSGNLNVSGNFNDGISSKDGLVIRNGNITVNAVDDAIRGKDYITIKGGTITTQTETGDAFHSDNEDNATLGYICVYTGSFDINSGSDGFQAETTLYVSGGDFNITCAGGSNASIDDSESAKALKAGTLLEISGGDFEINSADDGLHSDADMVIEGGTFNISTGDDGVHAELTLEINDGDITVSKSYEGIEASDITINGGTIHVVSSDDGLNGAGSTTNFLDITGGYVVVNAQGDGIDVNGSITMSGGTVLVHGPTGFDNGPLDYDNTFNISGGLLVAVGSKGMAQAPSQTSSQNSVIAGFNNALTPGTLIHIQTSDGLGLLTFTPEKNAESIVYSSPELVNGNYAIYTGGTSTEESTDGLYPENATYTPGTLLRSFTVSSSVTTVNIQTHP